MYREIFLPPNLLTLSRILVSPLILYAFDSVPMLVALGLFASLTDFLDGFLARRLDQRSRLGAVLDPIADKLFILMFLVAALQRQLLQPWMIGALLIRDLYTILAIPSFLLLFRLPPHKARFAARLPGKIVTTLQFFSFAVLILTPRALWTQAHDPIHWAYLPFYLLFPCSLWAMVDYTFFYSKAQKAPPPPVSSPAPILHSKPPSPEDPS